MDLDRVHHDFSTPTHRSGDPSGGLLDQQRRSAPVQHAIHVAEYLVEGHPKQHAPLAFAARFQRKEIVNRHPVVRSRARTANVEVVVLLRPAGSLVARPLAHQGIRGDRPETYHAVALIGYTNGGYHPGPTGSHNC